LPIGPSHESTGEAPFYLLYGRDARLPTEVALSMPKSLYLISVEDYKTELSMGLTEAWKQARHSIKRAQARQKSYYNRQARATDYQPGGRVMVYMP